MKTCKFISNSFSLYLFDDKNFLDIANKVKLKTAIFSLFIINLIFSIIGNVIYSIIKSRSFIETIISISIFTIIGFLFIFLIILIFSGFTHLIYKIFKANAKLKKLIIIVSSIWNVYFILESILGGILFYLIKHPNILYHKILFSIMLFFNIALLIWQFFVSFIYFGRIERVSKTKSLFIYSFIFILIIGIIFLLNYHSIINYLKAIY